MRFFNIVSPIEDAYYFINTITANLLPCVSPFCEAAANTIGLFPASFPIAALNKTGHFHMQLFYFRLSSSLIACLVDFPHPECFFSIGSHAFWAHCASFIGLELQRSR